MNWTCTALCWKYLYLFFHRRGCVCGMDYLNHTTNAREPFHLENGENGNEKATEDASEVAKMAIVSAYVIIFLFAFVGTVTLLWYILCAPLGIFTKTRSTCFWAIQLLLIWWMWWQLLLLQFLIFWEETAGCLEYSAQCFASWFHFSQLCLFVRHCHIVCIGREPLLWHEVVVRSIITVWLIAGLIFSGQLYKFKAEKIEERELLCGPEWHDGEEMSTLLYHWSRDNCKSGHHLGDPTNQKNHNDSPLLSADRLPSVGT